MSAVLANREIKPRRQDWLAGAGGFEPPHGGIKIRTVLNKNNSLDITIAATLYLGTKALFVKPLIAPEP